MTRIFRTLLLGLPLLVAPAFADQSGQPDVVSAGSAAQVQAGDLMLSGAFARATLPRAPVGGAFLTITNQGTTDDRLVSATAPVGKEVQIHAMEHKDGVMTMRQMTDGLAVPAGQTVVLEPGGFHLMLMGLTAPLPEGARIDLVLTFEQAGEVTVPFDILAVNARSAKGEAAPDLGTPDHGMAGHGQSGHGMGN